jgi:hypothetical protein
MLTQYMLYSRNFNAHRISVVQQTVNAHTICNTNNYVHNASTIVLFSSAIYCFYVLTEQQRDRRNIKYKQQTETHRAHVIENHTFKIRTQEIL